MKFKKINSEVFFTKEKITVIKNTDIKFLKKNIKFAKRKRIRLCAHSNKRHLNHEMFIALSKKTYIRPHKHINKSESLHVIEGSAEVVFFDDKGKIKKIISLSNLSSGSCFYYRIDKPIFHTFLVKSNLFIFHEVTQGPFKKSETIYPYWAPEEKNYAEVKKFALKLKKSIRLFKLRR